jgi:Trk K+ transport system NAD-binding subunit
LGKTVKDLEVTGRFRVAGILRHGEGIIPQESFILEAGDTVLGLAARNHIPKLRAKLHL